MQTVLQQITAIDGVLGCSLYNDKGKILAAACPLILDDKQLGTAAGIILDCLHALQISQTVVGMDIRFSEGRLLVKPLAGAFISVLCSKNVNMSMVTITLNLALRKLVQMLPKPGEEPAPTAASSSEGMKLKIAHIQKGDVGSSFDQLGMVAVSQGTAKQISDFFGKAGKKLKVTTEFGEGGTFPVMVINDVEMQYDNALVVGPGIERKLKAVEGATVLIALA